MPGSVSDSFDPEFGTGTNADLVREAILDVRRMVTSEIGTEHLQNIVDVCLSDKPPIPSVWTLTSRELRIIRFCLDRALESI